MNTITEHLARYLDGLEQIRQIKQQLKAIEEEAAEIPGVEKRPFKAIAAALHTAPGTIQEKLDSVEEFITLSFSHQDGHQEDLRI